MAMLLQRLQEIFHDPAYMKGVTNYFDLDVPFLMKSPLPLRKCLHIPVTFNYVSHIMRKPFFAICEQQRLRSACASVQSDQQFVVRCLDSIISSFYIGSSMPLASFCS